MNRRLAPITTLLALSTLGAAQPLGTRIVTPLIVHEWGTFTSVAGEDGRAVEWHALSGPPDLPCFVDRVRINIKGILAARVRMETPVLYFYAPRDMTLDVKVRFRQGVVTEWFPRAAVTPSRVDGSSIRRSGFSSSISWTDVRVSPHATADFPIDSSGSHYYLARQTDASPLQVDSANEKFLFYRGVGGFEPPIMATVGVDGSVIVKDPSGEPLGDVLLFENAGGRIAYQVRHVVSGQLIAISNQLVFDPPASHGEIAPPVAELEQILIARGLYPKEARAMLATWRDSWFEEGTRLFYVVSRNTIDAILPLKINPTPARVDRVFVGRVELVTSRAEQEVKEALATGDLLTLRKYGRFLEVIANRLIKDGNAADRARMLAMLQPFYAATSTAPAACE